MENEFINKWIDYTGDEGSPVGFAEFCVDLLRNNPDLSIDTVFVIALSDYNIFYDDDLDDFSDFKEEF